MPNKGSATMPSSSKRGGSRYILPDPSVPEPTKRTTVKAYRRSRSGCFTCRLRRKKCDEERPTCQSCSKLGLRCDYKTPSWWSTTEQRNRQRDRIKDRIRQTKVMEKEGSLRDYMERIKSMCRKSPAKPAAEMNHPLLAEPSSSSSTLNPYAEALPTPVTATVTSPITPFNFEFRSNSDTMWPVPALPVPNSYSNTVTATPTVYNPVNPLQPQIPTPELTSDEWYTSTTTPTTANTLFPSQTQQLLQQQYSNPNPYAPGYGSIPQAGPLSSSLESMIPINENDRPLLNHFVDSVIPLVFPMSEALQSGPERVREILSSVRTNRSYMHCCLSVAAIHMKTSMGMEDEMDHDIVKHRYEAICQLTKAHNRTNSNQVEAMDATLAMIFYHCSVGTSDDYLPDIPWHAHFRAVSNIVKRLHSAPSQLNVSLIAWIDILGATMLGETPQFAHTYRTKHLGGVSSGLQSLMGCDDRVMYLISEIACLESLKNEKHLDDLSLCHHINALTAQLDWTEPLDPSLTTPFTSDMLIKIITTLFRLGARIYLYSLLPAFDPYDPSIINLVNAITETLQYIPAGARGFDRALVWPLFMAGAHSIPTSPFRKTMSERVTTLGYLGDFGSFGRMYRVLKAIWRVADSTPSSPASSSSSSSSGSTSSLEQTEPISPQLHWREVMKQNKWSYLLM
ncbi:fungal-specific transcription factor domain-containing protein [Aspergillus cavernicola]|uniref:Fungal-specific transcription factor domain-containing protein n=1 Tax=Aspergillus cavernicola TaxID=176166 RepID=A0ABR4I1S2_9EURO